MSFGAQVVWMQVDLYSHCAREEDGTYFAHVPEVFGLYGKGKSAYYANQDLSEKILKLLKEAN